jgi:small-conductance mechanosensitive channel
MMLNDVQSNVQIVLRDFSNPGTTAGAAFYAVVFGVVAWLAGRAVRIGVNRTLQKYPGRIDPTTLKFVGDFARLAIYVITLLCYVYHIPVFEKVGKVLLTSVGLVSVVVGLAAQSTLGNLISGISLLLYRPFRLDDRLQVSAPTGIESGVVESLSLGYTTVRTDDNRKIVIPNSLIASQTSVNTSMAKQHTTCTVAVNITYNADIDKARKILTELAKAHAKTVEVTSCRVTALTDFAVTMTLTAMCADPNTAIDMKCDLLEAVKKRFDAEGVELAHASQPPRP